MQHKETHTPRTHTAVENGDLWPLTFVEVHYHPLDDLFIALLDLELLRCAAELEGGPG